LEGHYKAGPYLQDVREAGKPWQLKADPDTSPGALSQQSLLELETTLPGRDNNLRLLIQIEITTIDYSSR
jgi:hypothetical protein